jgi:hypothetical protein
LHKWYGRLTKLVQVECVGEEALRSIVVNAPESASWFIDRARVIEGLAGNVMGVCSEENGPAAMEAPGGAVKPEEGSDLRGG